MKQDICTCSKLPVNCVCVQTNLLGALRNGIEDEGRGKEEREREREGGREGGMERGREGGWRERGREGERMDGGREREEGGRAVYK